MKNDILNSHISMCNRRGVNPNTTSMKLVEEAFYNNEGVFNQSLFNRVVAVGILDRTQSPEERGALGRRYLISTDLFKNL